jgi:deoxyribodipyrimidine photo-lyase
MKEGCFQMIQNTRINCLNDLEPRPAGRFVLYWMQQSQRTVCNHALECAVQTANDLKLPLAVVFGLTADYPDANLRHYVFMLQGLREVASGLDERGIQFVLRYGSPPEVALAAGRKAAVIVCDRGYLRHQREWRRRVAREADCRVVQVESDLIVPVRVVSDKAEYAARTIRPKLHRRLGDYLKPLGERKLEHPGKPLEGGGLDPLDIDDLLRPLKIDRSVGPVDAWLRGGTGEALKRFRRFLQKSLVRYQAHHNQPQTDDISAMSPYLHFGQVAPLQLALKLKKAADKEDDNAKAYLEELIVRRELAANYVFFQPDYDRYEGLPAWARKTLSEHAQDERSPAYDLGCLEAAETRDPYWNAAMKEMRHTGFMHNYMRMYWAKKILEWSPTPEGAFERTLALNNKYFVDGRDPNSYTGVAWAFGLHDRPWKEREIFGKVRYMAASGLERKCDIEAYVKKVDRRVAAVTA